MQNNYSSNRGENNSGSSTHNRNNRSNQNRSRNNYGGHDDRRSSTSSSLSNTQVRKMNQMRTPQSKKSNAQPADKPQFLRRKHTIDRDGGDVLLNSTGGYERPKSRTMLKGNLASPNLNPYLNDGPLISTNSPSSFTGDNGEVVRIIPMGGSGEVGMNMNAIECGDDIILIDTGFGFGGGDKYPGVDYIVPDTEYLEQNRHKIKGIIYTHGHLDHIGGAPYVLPKIGPVPIYGLPLTLELLKIRLTEFDLKDKFLATPIDLDKPLELGCFKVDFFRLNHSIPDVIGLSIDTPMGKIVYCTDWKFDNTPFDGQLSDYGKLGKLGDEGVRILMTDSLGVLKPGHQISEKDIAKEVDKLFFESRERIIFTTFSSSIARMQHAIDACVKYGRKLALTGRSMLNNFDACYRMGYIKVPEGLMIDIKETTKYPAEKVCILCTGSQGEDMAALNRMARDEHNLVSLQGGDTVIMSSGVIPGNEDSVQDLIAKLSRKGVNVFNSKMLDLHVSGHACQDDLKLLFALTRPDYLQPMHGDHFMIKQVGKLAAKMGIPYDHLIISENGRITEMRNMEVVLTEDVISDSCLLVDGSGIGSVSEVVLEERRSMATQGSITVVMIVNKAKKLVGGPELISRGFVYMKNSTQLFDEIKAEIRKTFNNLDLDPKSKTYYSELRNALKRSATEFIFSKTEKMPMIIPVVVQV